METQVERADLLVKLMNFYDISNTIWEGRSAMGYDYIQSAITARIVGKRLIILIDIYLSRYLLGIFSLFSSQNFLYNSVFENDSPN